MSLDSLSDGAYLIDVTLEGGSGRASIASPAELSVKNQEATVSIEWSSSNYDYMVFDGVTYYPVNESGNSVFELPITELDEPVDVVADTTAMSVPHEISYTILLDASSIQNTQGISISTIGIWSCAAFALIAIGAVLHTGKRRKNGKVS